MPPSPLLPRLDALEQARERIARFIHRTPLVRLDLVQGKGPHDGRERGGHVDERGGHGDERGGDVDERGGHGDERGGDVDERGGSGVRDRGEAERRRGPLFAKAESLQRTGSFKLRGASNFLARMAAAARARGVVTHSSGNHALGVAAAAKTFAAPATIVIPDGAARVKVDGTLAWGADVVRCGNGKAERERTAERVVAERGASLVPPYDHPWIVEGQASVGLEIVDDLPDVANVLVPVGGGGLIAGVASALRARGCKALIIGVEPELAADARASFERGSIVTWPAEQVVRTVADGVRTQALGEHTFPIISAAVDAFVTVSEEEILDAAAWLLQRGHLLAEPTGALSLAAYRRLAQGDAPVTLRPGGSVVLLSGGNVDATMVQALAVREPRG